MCNPQMRELLHKLQISEFSASKYLCCIVIVIIVIVTISNILVGMNIE